MTHEFAAALKKESESRKGYYASISPSMFAGAPDCSGSCSGPKGNFSLELKVGADERVSLIATFMVKEATLLNAIAKKSGGKMSPPPERTARFEQTGALWQEQGTSNTYADNATLAKELCDRIG